MKIKIKISHKRYRIIWRRDQEGRPRHFFDGYKPVTLKQIKAILGRPTPDVWDPFVERLKKNDQAIFTYSGGTQFFIIKEDYESKD